MWTRQHRPGQNQEHGKKLEKVYTEAKMHRTDFSDPAQMVYKQIGFMWGYACWKNWALQIKAEARKRVECDFEQDAKITLGMQCKSALPCFLYPVYTCSRYSHSCAAHNLILEELLTKVICRDVILFLADSTVRTGRHGVNFEHSNVLTVVTDFLLLSEATLSFLFRVKLYILLSWIWGCIIRCNDL